MARVVVGRCRCCGGDTTPPEPIVGCGCQFTRATLSLNGLEGLMATSDSAPYDCFHYEGIAIPGPFGPHCNGAIVGTAINHNAGRWLLENLNGDYSSTSISGSSTLSGFQVYAEFMLGTPYDLDDPGILVSECAWETDKSPECDPMCEGPGYNKFYAYKIACSMGCQACEDEGFTVGVGNPIVYTQVIWPNTLGVQVGENCAFDPARCYEEIQDSFFIELSDSYTQLTTDCYEDICSVTALAAGNGKRFFDPCGSGFSDILNIGHTVGMRVS